MSDTEAQDMVDRVIERTGDTYYNLFPSANLNFMTADDILAHAQMAIGELEYEAKKKK